MFRREHHLREISQGIVEKYSVAVSTSSHHYKSIQAIMKTILKLCSRRWLKTFHNIVVNLAPYALGLLNFITWPCKLQNVIFESAITSWVPKRWIFFSHSTMMVDRNKTSLKNSSLNYLKSAFLLHLLWHSLLQARVNRVNKLGAHLFKILLKHQSFLYSSIWSISSISSIFSISLFN